MRLVLTADTHVPKRAKDLPAALWKAIDAADAVVHAGDWVDVALLDSMQARAKRLIGVVGNNDGPALAARLPEVARAELDGLKLAVVHETGPAVGRERRCAQRFGDCDLLVFGHSHIPWDSMTPDRQHRPLGHWYRSASGRAARPLSGCATGRATGPPFAGNRPPRHRRCGSPPARTGPSSHRMSDRTGRPRFG